MKTIEIETRFDSKGQLIIPDDIRRRVTKDTLAKVIIYDKHLSKQNKRDYKKKNFDEIKDFWENYEMTGIWNGE